MAHTSGVGGSPLLATLLNQAAAAGAAQGRPPRESGSAPALDASDKAQLSSTASVLASQPAQPEIRTDKVEQLRSAIASGTYNVPASSVAESLLRSLLG